MMERMTMKKYITELFMKKLVSLLLAVWMCLSVGAMLTACGEEKHTHTYQTEWSKDATHHWQACEGENCTDVANKAEHEWNSGEITTKATSEADGVKTFTCTVCNAVKTEPVAFSGVSEAEWLALTNPDLFKNVTATTTQIDRYFKTVSIVKIVDGRIYLSATLYDLKTNEVVDIQSGDLALTDAFYDTLIPDLKQYNNIEYDSERKVYCYTQNYEANISPDITATYTKSEWTLRDGKLWTAQSEFWYIDKTDGRVDCTIYTEYSDYGTTVAPID